MLPPSCKATTGGNFVTLRLFEIMSICFLIYFFPCKGVFHLIHTAFQEYVFLVVENQRIAEMDKKLNSTLESHLKKGQLVTSNSMFSLSRDPT